MKEWSLAAAIGTALMGGGLWAAQAGAGAGGGQAGGAGEAGGGQDGGAVEESDADSPAGQESRVQDRARDRDEDRSNQDPVDPADRDAPATTERDADRPSDRARNEDALPDRPAANERTDEGGAAGGTRRGAAQDRNRDRAPRTGRDEGTEVEDVPAAPGTADRAGRGQSERGRPGAGDDRQGRTSRPRTEVGGDAGARGQDQQVQFGAQLEQGDEGLTVQSLGESGIATEIGLQEGDQIISVDGRTFQSPQEFNTFLTHQSGRRVPFVVMRDGQRQTLYWEAAQFGGDRFGGPEGQFGPRRAALGVTLWDRPDGVVIRQIAPNSPAAQIGLMPGDRIVSFNGQEYDSYQTFVTDVGQIGMDESYDLIIERDGQTQELTVQPAAWDSVFTAGYGGQGQAGFDPNCPLQGQSHGQVVGQPGIIYDQYGQPLPQQPFDQPQFGGQPFGQPFGVARPDLRDGAQGGAEIDQLHQRIDRLEQELQQLRSMIQQGQGGAAAQPRFDGGTSPPAGAIPQRVNRQPQLEQDDLGLPPGAAQPETTPPSGAADEGRDLNESRLERREAGGSANDNR